MFAKTRFAIQHRAQVCCRPEQGGPWPSVCRHIITIITLTGGRKCNERAQIITIVMENFTFTNSSKKTRQEALRQSQIKVLIKDMNIEYHSLKIILIIECSNWQSLFYVNNFHHHLASGQGLCVV